MYQFKTNRVEQWAQLEKRDILEGRDKASLLKEKNYFFNGPDGEWRSESGDYTTNLAYLPERDLDGWQRYFDQFVNKPLSLVDIDMLQSGMLAGGSGYFQEPEDDAYYVEALFGKKWTPATILKLNINTEEPMEPLDANKVMGTCGRNLAFWLDAEKGEDTRGGYIRFIPEFLEDVPKHIDQRVYDSKKYLHETIPPKSNVRIRALKNSVRKIILWSHKPITGDAYYDERINVAKQFFAMFEAAKDRYPEYDSFVARVLEEGDD
ncbi:MAG: hypothetical protein ACI9Y1_002686 [Lentisphaeria bacterium]|jgi:hypothetical protein